MRRAIALVLVSTLLGCAGIGGIGLEAPEVLLVNVTPLESTLFEQRVRLDLRVLNPNPRPLEIEGVDLVLELNEVPLARAIGSVPVSVPARGDALAQVDASITLLDVVRQALAYAEREETVYYLFGRVFLANTLPRSLSFESTGSVRGLDRLLRQLERGARSAP